MRLAPFSHDPMPNPVAGHATLDAVLALNAKRNPDGIAMLDQRFPHLRTWGQIDRAVSALAEIFAYWRLEEDAAVGVQLGSSAEGALACLALWRAGLIPAMLPLAWRRQETARALLSVNASAVITMTEGGGARLAGIACEIAAALDAIRFVACFGPDAPDGATPLDELLTVEDGSFEPAERPEDAADHVAVVTFDAGGVAVPRSHNDLVAAGLAPLLAAKVEDGASLLSTLDLARLGGLATGLAPWLITGCRVAFHQATTTEAFAAAIDALDATHVVLPGRAADRLAADGALAGKALKAAILVWHAPDGRDAKPLGLDQAAIVDTIVFGELGVTAGARTSALRPAPLPLGPTGPNGLDPLIDLRVLPDGRLFVRGPACPQAAFPGGPGAPSLAFGADGYLDTGLAGIADRVANRATLGGRRRGVVQVGGISVAVADAEAAARAAGVAGAVSARDDALLGSRLVVELGPEDDAISAEDAAAAIEAAGYGPALAPVAVTGERARKTA